MTAVETFSSFLRLGIQHILLGLDHLLFLCGLLLVAHGWRQLVLVVTSFTIAHSLTLGLAAFNLVNVPDRVAEPLIAATILFVGVENIVLHGEPRGRWVVAFVFGLIHGLGFASVLRGLGLGENGRGMVLPLLSFNLGIELGQLAVALLLLPFLLRLAQSPNYRSRWQPSLSGLIAVAGAYWLVQRLA